MEHYFVLQINSFYNEQIFSIIFKVTSTAALTLSKLTGIFSHDILMLLTIAVVIYTYVYLQYTINEVKLFLYRMK